MTEFKFKGREKEYQREWVRNARADPGTAAKMRTAVNEARWRRRLAAFEILGGARCVNCGCADPRMLEINHLKIADHPRGNKGGELLDRGITNGRLNPDDFNVLCRPCNALDYLERRFPDIKGKCWVRWL